jgi:hypothetical protein
MTMVLSPLSMRRCPCRCPAGVVALITMVLLPLIRNNVVAFVTTASMPSSSWHCCPCHNGVGVIINAQVSLPSCNGIVALVVMALLLLMYRRLCRCRDCNCRPHDNGVVAIVNAQASLPLSSWCCCPCNNGIVALALRQRCCPHRNGIIVIPKLASLSSLQWCCCHH